jgi:multidrug efflux pump
VIYAAIIAAVVGWMYVRMPTSFLPNEDQGYMIVNVQLPPGATQNRTLAVMQQVEAYMLKQPEVQNMVSVLGFSFSGSARTPRWPSSRSRTGTSAPGRSTVAQALAGRAFGALMGVRDAFIFPLSPPPIPELGNATGFNFRLQDRAGNGHEALLAARNQLLGMAGQSKVLTGVRPDGLEDAPQLQLDIDRDKAQRWAWLRRDQQRAVDGAGLGLRQRLPQRRPAAARGRAGRRAGAHAAGGPAALTCPTIAGQRCRCRPSRARAGSPAPMQTCATTATHDAHRRRRRARLQHRRRDGRDGAPGRAAAAGLRLRVDRPVARGAAVRLAGATLLLASRCWRCSCAWRRCTRAGRSRWRCCWWCRWACWACCWACQPARLPNDVYFKVGLITIIGLSAKNAVLIIEFAKDLQAEGKSLSRPCWRRRTCASGRS